MFEEWSGRSMIDLGHLGFARNRHPGENWRSPDIQLVRRIAVQTDGTSNSDSCRRVAL